MSNIIHEVEADEAKVSAEVKGALGDAVKVGGSVAVVLGVVAAILPELHLPAADTAVVSAISAAVSGFLSWAARHGIKSAEAAK